MDWYLIIFILIGIKCDHEKKCLNNCSNGYCQHGECICNKGYGGLKCDFLIPIVPVIQIKVKVKKRCPNDYTCHNGGICDLTTGKCKCKVN